VLSLDYEVFGNGSGDVRRDMVEPTQRLLALCNEYGAKLSIMLEVGAYWAMSEAERAGLLDLGYSPTRQVEEQIRQAARDGHDVQLHLHPWWIGAGFAGGRWQLHPEYRQITDLPHGVGSEGDPLSILGVLYEGKRTLEDMVHPVRPEYECLVYRAAMFWGQPSERLITGLKRVGLRADSSVVSGLYEASPVPTDYRNAPSSAGYWWTSAEDIGQSGRKGEHIIEFPIYSKTQTYLCNFKWTKLHASLKRSLVERVNVRGHGMMQARNSSRPLRQILKELGTVYAFKYDFCKLGAADMIRWLRRLIRDDRRRGDQMDTPLVMLGHSKDFWNDRNLDRFLGYVKTACSTEVCFSTLGELTRMIVNQDAQSREGKKLTAR